MKKIGVLTFHGVLNHGAILQAYALQKFLNSNGADAELVNYAPSYFLWQVYRPAKGIYKTVLKYSRLLKFKKFERNHLVVSKKSYNDIKSLEYINYDALICGSDQVWNKSITKGAIDKAYLLDFPFRGEKYSYAASAGANSILSEQGVLRSLKNFTRLGVREAGLYQELLEAQLNVDHVADPTFLLRAEEYDDIAYSDLLPQFPYIVSYEVSTDETRVKYSEAVGKLKSTLGLPVVHIGDKALDSADINILNISTNDWVALIKKSSFVVTNSFHGCSFGIKFRKPLVVLSHLDKERNARPISLLKTIGMSAVFYDVGVTDFDSVTVETLYQETEYVKYDAFVKKSRTYAFDLIGL
jgi:hypothetical protein